MAAEWKQPVSASDFIGAAVFGTFFSLFNLFSVSVDTFAAGLEPAAGHSFLVSFYRWKAEPPVIKFVFVPLLPMLPFVIIAMMREAFRSLCGWRRASTLRHALDIIQPCLLLTVLSISLRLAPAAEVGMIEACLSIDVRRGPTPLCLENAAAARSLHTLTLLLQLSVFTIDIVRYKTSSAAAKKEE